MTEERDGVVPISAGVEVLTVGAERQAEGAPDARYVADVVAAPKETRRYPRNMVGMLSDAMRNRQQPMWTVTMTIDDRSYRPGVSGN